ncbi:MAG: topoisomerase IV, partial [Prochlorococcaceae cyanobacterium]
LRLLPGEAVVGAAAVAGPEGAGLLASRRGWIKRLGVDQLRLCQRGDLGQIGLRFSHRLDQLADLCDAEAALVAAVLSSRRSARLQPADLESQDSGGVGVSLGLADREELQALVPLVQA